MRRIKHWIEKLRRPHFEDSLVVLNFQIGPGHENSEQIFGDSFIFTLMEYKPGKHLIATLQTPSDELIRQYAAFNLLADTLIGKYGLVKLGQVYHNFLPGGFTAVICLSESHLSIHTWPEHRLVNLDVYLSNFQQSNDNIVQSLFREITAYFQATVIAQQTITR